MKLLEKIKALEISAEEFGFAWETSDQIMEQIKSEFDEVNERLQESPKQLTLLEEEVGDLLHAVFSLCVFEKLNPTTTLKKAIDKFERRLSAVKELAKQDGLSSLKDHSFDELMIYWNKAKAMVG